LEDNQQVLAHIKLRLVVTAESAVGLEVAMAELMVDAAEDTADNVELATEVEEVAA
jgi:hypothetical protein